ncbi:hypothetical protein PybrP1_010141 [[Pythium] brassicae (nom. inval.)]|nr:hypothetical protein PybrP1_010141 [[Pythium] brassicae (nom. inval.)]
MNILRVPDAKLATSSGDKFKPTSCEGYVTKRGHFRKSWRVRYLVFNGSDLLVAYFESRDASRTAGAVPKGSFYVSSVEKHEYWVGMLGGREKPFGFKLVGHAPRKGFVELDVFVESLADLNKWVEVVQNGLDAAKKRTWKGVSDSVGTKNMLGFSLGAPSQLQVKKLAATKEELLRDALREIEGAKLIGREAVHEIVAQGEKLDQLEGDLGQVESDLDHADKLLRHMRRPVLHVFSSDTRSKPSSKSASVGAGGGARSPGRAADSSGLGAAEQPHGDEPLSDLERLALALGELEQQANLMSAEAVKSTEQIVRVEERLTAVNNRVQAQTKKANVTMKAGNLF